MRPMAVLSNDQVYKLTVLTLSVVGDWVVVGECHA
jgi:hypothetical protein